MSKSNPYETVTARGVPPVMRHRDIACNPRNAPVFFPRVAGGNGRASYESAKAVCQRCPLERVYECARWAIVTGQQYGYWGGTAPKDRRKHPLWNTEVGSCHVEG